VISDGVTARSDIEVKLIKKVIVSSFETVRELLFTLKFVCCVDTAVCQICEWRVSDSRSLFNDDTSEKRHTLAQIRCSSLGCHLQICLCVDTLIRCSFSESMLFSNDTYDNNDAPYRQPVSASRASAWDKSRDSQKVSIFVTVLLAGGVGVSQVKCHRITRDHVIKSREAFNPLLSQ